MFKFRLGKIGSEKGFFSFLHKQQDDDWDDEESKGAEDRNHERVYIQFPVILNLELPEKEEEAFIGQASDVSISGAQLNFWVKEAFFKELSNNPKEAQIKYKFISPAEIAGEFIESKIRWHVSKLHKKKKLIEIKFGVQNIQIAENDQKRITDFISQIAISAIQEDISKLTDIMQKRELTKEELEIYTALTDKLNNLIESNTE